MLTAVLFDLCSQLHQRLLAGQTRADARAGDDHASPPAPAARPPVGPWDLVPLDLGLDAHPGITDAARQAGLDPAGGVAPPDGRAARRAARDAMRGRTPDELIAVGALALSRLLDPRPQQAAAQRRAAEALVRELVRMRLPWGKGQAIAVLEASRFGRDAAARRLALELAVSATGQAIAVGGHSGRLLSAMVRAVEMAPRAASQATSRRLLAELCVLLPPSPQRNAVAVTAFTPAWPGSWTGRLRRALTAGPPLTDADIRLLAHLPCTVAAREPAASWRNRCQQLAGADPDPASASASAARLPGRLLAIAVDALRSGGVDVLGTGDVRLLAGAAWAAVVLRDRSALALVDQLGVELARLALHGHEPLVAACAQATAAAADRRAPQDAWAALAVLRQTTRRDSIQEQVDDAVCALLVRTGGAGGSPTFGLDAAGRRAVPVGDATAMLILERDRVRLRWLGRRGGLVDRAPADAHPLPAAELLGLRRLARAATVALTVHEPRRLEWLLRRGQVWEGHAWRGEVLDHPLAGSVAGRLLWQVRPDDPRFEADQAGGGGGDGWVTVQPAADGTLVDVAGRPVRLPMAHRVRLWHPADADGTDAEAWTALRGRQPIAQLDRVTYHPTPAEVASGHRSARFAGHLVRRRAAATWLTAQGWTVDTRRLTATIGLLGGRMRAVLALAPPEAPALARFGAVTGGVAFEQRSAAGIWAPLPIPEVPSRTFSEVMWDLDRMVRAARDQLVALHEQLASLLPRLRIADRCELGGRDLHVRGDRGTYRISLANAAVYELQRGRHVCIIPAWNHDRDDRSLPVPAPAEPELGGERLRMILSKAFLLADDAHITDEVILSQLPPTGSR